MKNRIEELLDKYWEGQSSLSEEKELKDLLEASEGFEMEKAFFLGLSKIKVKESTRLHKPIESGWKFSDWMKLAAALLLLLVSGKAIMDYQRGQAEKEAFEKVMQAFSLIQTNMGQGTDKLQIMEEFSHLKVTEELFSVQKNRD